MTPANSPPSSRPLEETTLDYIVVRWSARETQVRKQAKLTSLLKSKERNGIDYYWYTSKWLIKRIEYKGDGPFVGHVDIKKGLQRMGKEVADLIPIEWT